LLVYALGYFELEHRPDGKSSVREQLEQVAKTTGKRDERLDVEQPFLLHVWYWFCEIYSGDIPTWSELQAWQNVLQENPTPSEFRLLRRIAMGVNNGRSNTASKS